MAHVCLGRTTWINEFVSNRTFADNNIFDILDQLYGGRVKGYGNVAKYEKDVR